MFQIFVLVFVFLFGLKPQIEKAAKCIFSNCLSCCTGQRNTVGGKWLTGEGEYAIPPRAWPILLHWLLTMDGCSFVGVWIHKRDISLSLLASSLTTFLWCHRIPPRIPWKQIVLFLFICLSLFRTHCLFSLNNGFIFSYIPSMFYPYCLLLTHSILR